MLETDRQAEGLAGATVGHGMERLAKQGNAQDKKAPFTARDVVSRTQFQLQLALLHLHLLLLLL